MSTMKLTTEQARTLEWVGESGQWYGAKDRVLNSLRKKGLLTVAGARKDGRHNKFFWVRTDAATTQQGGN